MQIDFSSFDQLLEGVQILNKELVYEYINQSASNQANKAKSDLIGKKYIEAHPGIEKSAFYQHLLECLEAQSERIVILEFQLSDGSPAFYDLCIRPFSQGLIILSVDITKQKLLEKELHSLNKRFEEELLERTKNMVVQLEKELMTNKKSN
ncbi:MAG: hypothetical protein RI922_233 [Bacteroidota bacterium]|jgi:PAS domain-containing protein